MPSQKPKYQDLPLVQEWTLPAAATLGSSVRAKGLVLEIRARLPLAARKSLDIQAGVLALRMAESTDGAVQRVVSIVSEALQGIENLPVIPREIEDILSISATERHRWLKDGRLPSAGTRTVKLRGRAKKITFHVFDPRLVEDILDSDRTTTWREEDAATTAENRRRAAWKAKLTRAQKNGPKVVATSEADGEEAERPQLLGWEEFARNGLPR